MWEALSYLLPGNDLALWPLVCMAATLGGTMRAPLMAAVFAFGLTHYMSVSVFEKAQISCALQPDQTQNDSVDVASQLNLFGF